MQTTATASELKIAVASNFTKTMKILVKEFESQSTTRIQLSSGSTGRHYAQIVNGAPYDIFFSADAKRPRILEQQGLIHPNSRFTYAIGSLALLINQPNIPTLSDLKSPFVKRIAIANPKLAPYGYATKQLLVKHGLWKGIRNKIIKGENVSQALHFYTSGNAQAALIAKSQLLPAQQSQSQQISPTHHTPIQQQVVVINNSKQAKEFMDFIQSPKAHSIIKSSGYGVEVSSQ